MKKYILIEHTADIRLKIEADSEQELFLAALQGMAQIINSQANLHQKPSLSQKITIRSLDTTTLLIDFLSEVLTLSHLHKAVFFNVTFNLLTPNNLDATVYGIPVSKFLEDIKAVTYHEAEVIDNNEILSTTIVFDI